MLDSQLQNPTKDLMLQFSIIMAESNRLSNKMNKMRQRVALDFSNKMLLNMTV